MSVRTYSHRLTPRTILGVGISAPVVYAFTDQPRDYDDFCALYSRWLAGPVRLHPAMSEEERRRESALNWRVFGSAEPTLTRLDEMGWYPNQHPGPLGLWGFKSLDMTGIPEAVAGDGALLNAVLRAARAAVAQAGKGASKVARDLADVRLPDGLDPRRWPRLLDLLRPEAMMERLLVETWARNVVTDNGATSMLKNLWNSAGGTVAIMSHIVIAQLNQGYAQQTGANITNASGAQTSIACAGGVQAVNLPASGFVTWSYGTTNAETWQLGASAPGNVGATSITVLSQTTVSGHTHAAGDYVVNNPTTSDNPSSVSNSADSGALPGGDFTFSGTGAGNRQVQIQYTFSTATAAGAYTEAYTSNAGTIAAGTTANHVITPPNTINSSTSLQVTLTEKV